jgi:cysteine desulfurase family protein (TIGR01976 family)
MSEPRSTGAARPAAELDLDFIRQQFPAFRHATTGEWVMAENAGGSYAPRQVSDALHHFMTATKIQPGWPAAMSAEAGAAMRRSHERFAAALNVAADELHFGPSTSMNTYVLAQALRPCLAAGDEVIVTNQDHEANVGAWRRLADGNSGIVVREWGVEPETGRLEPAGLERLLSRRTRLVCVPQCSNIAGEINDIPAITRLAHEAGALVAVDAVSYAPHILADVRALDADIYYFSLYKVYGPHQGLMFVRREVLDRLEHQGHYFLGDDPAKRLTPAGPQHGEIACAGGVIDYLEDVHSHHYTDEGRQAAGPRAAVAAVMERFHLHETLLANRVLTYLREKGCRIIGPDRAEPHRRAATIAFTSPKASPGNILAHLTARKIAAGGGSHFYAPRLLEAIGIDPEEGVMRLSFVHYNTDADVDRVLEALGEII